MGKEMVFATEEKEKLFKFLKECGMDKGEYVNLAVECHNYTGDISVSKIIRDCGKPVLVHYAFLDLGKKEDLKRGQKVSVNGAIYYLLEDVVKDKPVLLVASWAYNKHRKFVLPEVKVEG